MKIIDLLNKIANGENVPKKIKYCYQVYKVADVGEDYYNYENNCWFFKDKFDVSVINDEIDLIEDDKKEIAKIDLYKDMYYHPTLGGEYLTPPTEYEMAISRKINEIIEVINNEHNK